LLPWLFTFLAVGALVFVVWRYAIKVRRGDAIVR